MFQVGTRHRAPYPLSEAKFTRAGELFAAYARDIHERTDRLFAGLMLLQWFGGIVFALCVSPLAWSGITSSTHIHVWRRSYSEG